MFHVYTNRFLIQFTRLILKKFTVRTVFSRYKTLWYQYPNAMDLAQKLTYTESHNYKQYHPSQNPPQLVTKCHNFTTLEYCSVSQNCARFFVGFFGQFSFALIPAGEPRHDGAVKHIFQVLLSQRAALHIQLTPCTAVKSLIIFSSWSGALAAGSNM